MSGVVRLLALLLLAAWVAPLAAQGPIQKKPRPKPTRSSIPETYYDGFLVSMEPHQVEIETLSLRRVVCALTDETQFTTAPTDFHAGDRIGVTTNSPPQDHCVASWVGRPEERFQEHRRKPLLTRRGPDGELEGNDPPLERTDPLVLKAVEANQAFTDRLPDYTCHQEMKRASSRNLGKKWDEKDVVEADVLIYRGDDYYQNITIDGSPFDGPITQIGWVWSRGEFSSILLNLFGDHTRAEFEPDGEPEEIAGYTARPYKYHVEQGRSLWTLVFNNREYNPEYIGRVWLDVETGRAIRVELEAQNLPWDYPMITAEAMVEYADVEIGEAEYLLPAVSSNMSCVRGSARCYRNELAFAGCQKFTSDSSMWDTNSSITFGDVVEEEDQ